MNLSKIKLLTLITNGLFTGEGNEIIRGIFGGKLWGRQKFYSSLRRIPWCENSASRKDLARLVN